MSTLIRRRRNRVNCLLTDDGEWISDKVMLKDLAVSFYSQLFSAERVIVDAGLSRGKFPRLTCRESNGSRSNLDAADS